MGYLRAGVLMGLLALLTVRAPGSEVLTLEQATEEALRANLGLLAEKYAITIAEAGVITARLRPNPILTVEGDHLDWLGTGFNSINEAGPPEYSIRTDFVFERGGKRASRIALAKSQVAFARLQVLESARELLLNVRRAFVDLQLAKHSLTLAEENLRAWNEIIDVNRARVKAGDLAAVELVRTRVAALQFRNQVKQAQLNVRTAKNQLQLLLGRTSLNSSFEITGEFRQDAAPAALPEVQAKALELRPDLLALQQAQARSQAELRLQLAQGRVDYTIGSEYRRQQGVNGRGNSLGLFFQTNLPIFNRNQGEIERVRREQQQLQARIRELQTSIGVEVQNSFEQAATARELLTSIEADMLTQAKDVREITEYSYRRGEATLIEFLDAQRAFNDTMQAYNEARAEYAKSLYGLESAAGIDGSTR